MRIMASIKQKLLHDFISSSDDTGKCKTEERIKNSIESTMRLYSKKMYQTQKKPNSINQVGVTFSFLQNQIKTQKTKQKN